MCFKLSHLSYYVCSYYEILLNEILIWYSYDKSRRQKRFHTILSENTLQIFAVILLELAESEDCDFSCAKLALQKVFEIFSTFEKQRGVYKLAYKSVAIKKFIFHYWYEYCCCWSWAQDAFYRFWLSPILMEMWAILPEWVFSARASAWPMLAIDDWSQIRYEVFLKMTKAELWIFPFCSMTRQHS